MARHATHHHTGFAARGRTVRAAEKFPPARDDLDPARGMILAALFGAALWALVIAALAAFL